MMIIMLYVKRPTRSASGVMMMRYPPQETARRHENMLAMASRLFREKGFLDVSLSTIMKAIGLTHGPFYNHFASKQDLVVRSIEHASAQALADISALPPTGEARDAYIAGYLSRAHCEAPGSGCLIAALAAEASRDPAARGALTRHLTGIFESFGSHFPWKKQGSARDQAIFALAAMVGGVVLARASADETLGDEILDAVRARLLAART